MFRTELNIEKAPFQIGLHDPILTIGSCFSDEIGQRLVTNKFKTLVNPFGTVYNPVSIFKLLTQAIDQQPPDDQLYYQHDDRWVHFDFHSSYAATTKVALQEALIEQLTTVGDFLKSAKYLIVTLGTAYTYRHKQQAQIVSNCHKVPASHFDKLLLNQQQILAAWQTLRAKLSACNPALQVIWTVSPVRHIKDTLTLNNVSKSVLRLSTHTLCEQGHGDYFPSYEFVLDDLRDYRFYKSDMIHPNEDAIAYIWNKFTERYFDSATLQFLKEWAKIKSAIAHRPFQATSAQHQQFIKNTISRIRGLPSEINFDTEIQFLEEQLID